MPTSVLRRYTPPTCTLEIAATGSALSRWTDRAVLKHLRFQLSFDDPTLPEDSQVTIRGDRLQLEALWETVTAYVQSLLNQPAVPLYHSGGLYASELYASTEENYAQLEPEPTVLSEQPLPTDIHFQPRGLLNHQLFLGTLANERSGATVPLSTLQLFDLANALDEYHNEALTLPTLGRASWSKSRGSWAGIAAALLLTVGSSAALLRFVTAVSSPSPQLAASSSSEESQARLDAKSSARLPAAPGLEPLPSALTLQPPPPPLGATKNAAPPQPVRLPDTAPINPGTVPRSAFPTDIAPGGIAPRSPTLLPAPNQASGGTVAILPQAPLSPEMSPENFSGAAMPIDPQTANSDGGAIASLRSSASSDAATQMAPPIGVPNAAAPSAAAASGAATAARSTAFDAIPQVAEIRNYFEQSWQPPQGLTQTLEYRLVLNANGSLQRIVPLGQAAATFLDRTNMPLTNEAFVSPVENGGNPAIRLVLGQDGKVQTFLEQRN
ncbi:MAG: DUF4335 domain-containing protein [Leptolyngbyaceae cyanobacterium CRU_2_3]|nr:DUF4335 domain-containing protein [Leptolyngbyaceae cyanobacterium CRU_2_3]